MEVLKKLLEEKSSSDKLFMEEEARRKEEEAKRKEEKACSEKLFMDDVTAVFDNMQSALDEKDRTLQDFVTFLDLHNKAVEVLEKINRGNEMQSQIRKKKNKPGKRQRDAAKARALLPHGTPSDNPSGVQTGGVSTPLVCREGSAAGPKVASTPGLVTPDVASEGPPRKKAAGPPKQKAAVTSQSRSPRSPLHEFLSPFTAQQMENLGDDPTQP